MSGAYNRGKRREVIVRLTETEADRLVRKLYGVPEMHAVVLRIEKARAAVVAKWQRYREMPD